MSKTQKKANEIRENNKFWYYGVWNVYNVSNRQIIRLARNGILKE